MLRTPVRTLYYTPCAARTAASLLHPLNTHAHTRARSNQGQIKSALGGKAADNVKKRVEAVVQEVGAPA